MEPKTNKKNSIIYHGEIVAGSLLIRESRMIAGLLLENADSNQWHQATEIENILQKRSPAAAKRQAKLIRNRLILMKPELWEMIREGSADIAVQAALAATIKHSRLVGDFMDTVIRQNWLIFSKKITSRDWEEFFETCIQIDTNVGNWTESTRKKLKQVVFRIMAESKYIASTRNPELQPVSVLPEIIGYLNKYSEDYVLRCMRVTE